MHKSLKILSLLLAYPDPGLGAALPAFEAALDEELERARAGDPEALIDAPGRDALARLAADVAGLDPYEAEERYVWLFDRTRALSLHLFEHVHCESRDRGQAMVTLAETYAAAGLEIDARELPDYLPLFLEFVATRPAVEARRLLGQAAPVIAAIGARLHERDSVYALAFDALGSIADGAPDGRAVEEMLRAPTDDPSDLAALDRIWHEEAVAFGGTERRTVGLEELRASLGARRARAPTQPGGHPA